MSAPMSLANPLWAPWTILLPLVGALVVVLLPARRSPWFGVTATFATAVAAAGALARLARVGPERHLVGGWEPPLGIALVLDGWGLVFVGLNSLVSLAVALYATRAWCDAGLQARFWGLFLLLQAGLNALFLSGDLFNLFVTLEVVGICAAGLTALERKAEAVRAALRYLLLSLAGSFTYLAAVVLVYREHGTLDLALLAAQGPTQLAPVLVALMTVGLMLKTALFPFHGWLPPAHASAPAPVSALLSGLVVKGSLFVLLRASLLTWPERWGGGTAQLLGVLGGLAVFWGYTLALRSERLKAMIAYSTVAQIGQIFLVFPLTAPGSTAAIAGATLLAMSHGLAKAAIFLAAGNVLRAAGRDRLEDLAAFAPHRPRTQAAFWLAAPSLIGLPPSAGFLGKWLLLEVSIARGQWPWAGVLVAATLLSAALMVRILRQTLSHRPDAAPSPEPVAPVLEWTPLTLAAAAACLGLAGGPLHRLLGQLAGPTASLLGMR